MAKNTHIFTNRKSIPTDPKTGKALNISLFSLKKPFMRGFHLAWLSFFSAFTTWFAIPPLIEVIGKDLDLSIDQVAISDIASVSSTIIFRIFVGPLIDQFGPRKVMSIILVIGSSILAFLPLVSTADGLIVLRFFTGILGACFVCCQIWTTTLFSKQVVGSANAITAGWGNVGGGSTYLIMPQLYAGFIHLELSSPISWKLAMVIPIFLCYFSAFLSWNYADNFIPTDSLNKNQEKVENDNPLDFHEQYDGQQQQLHEQDEQALQKRNHLLLLSTDGSNQTLGIMNADQVVVRQEQSIEIDEIHPTHHLLEVQLANPYAEEIPVPLHNAHHHDHLDDTNTIASTIQTESPDSTSHNTHRLASTTIQQQLQQHRHQHQDEEREKTRKSHSPFTMMNGISSLKQTLNNVLIVFSDHNVMILMIHYALTFGVEITVDNKLGAYFARKYTLDIQMAGKISSIFGLLNIFSRPFGGILSDILFRYYGLKGRLVLQAICIFVAGIPLILVWLIVDVNLGTAIVLFTVYSIFCQAGCGTTFGLVPYMDEKSVSIAAGLVGAGGNLGAVAFSSVFKAVGKDFDLGFMIVGLSVSIVGFVSSFFMNPKGKTIFSFSCKA